MPLHGYTKMFAAMLDHSNIELRLGVDFLAERQTLLSRDSNGGGQIIPHVIYTGPLDAWFDHCYGHLPYRSLRFEHAHLPDVERCQEVGTINYPNEHDYTRITEYKHLTGQTHSGTSITREYPVAEGDPYYPIPSTDNEMLSRQYLARAAEEKGVTFIGRLAEYRYYNMDQVIGVALAAAEKLLGK
jgi:UDP-galactopyranose mutase